MSINEHNHKAGNQKLATNRLFILYPDTVNFLRKNIFQTFNLLILLKKFINKTTFRNGRSTYGLLDQ